MLMLLLFFLAKSVFIFYDVYFISLKLFDTYFISLNLLIYIFVDYHSYFPLKNTSSLVSMILEKIIISGDLLPRNHGHFICIKHGTLGHAFCTHMSQPCFVFFPFEKPWDIIFYIFLVLILNVSSYYIFTLLDLILGLYYNF